MRKRIPSSAASTPPKLIWLPSRRFKDQTASSGGACSFPILPVLRLLSSSSHTPNHLGPIEDATWGPRQALTRSSRPTYLRPLADSWSPTTHTPGRGPSLAPTFIIPSASHDRDRSTTWTASFEVKASSLSGSRRPRRTSSGGSTPQPF